MIMAVDPGQELLSRKQKIYANLITIDIQETMPALSYLKFPLKVDRALFFKCLIDVSAISLKGFTEN